ncbi:peroxiredoxin [Luteibacter sp. PPL201]|jgi:peroxiredoxin Q/BCP|uniref:thioredoxin-dependent peroxiredoxin n=1 Tax=Luteibacter sahnii TaxID=3021977 RepID=A0ABT6B5J0_9GAMM|nr:peroxiredoxin [Luteibacter sp. PPL193]MDY1548673.1 peroxiredoxin [Luteibacter sp. PPL193]
MRRLLVSLALCLVSLSAWAAQPTVGDKAPDFRLQDQKGTWHTLDTHKGQWLVLYFYPKDFTAGCTTEVCTYRDDTAKLHKAGAEVLGVSLDDVKSHQEFAEKYHVPFPLLSDADSKVATDYGVLVDHLGIKYARRETFLIDPSGKIVKIYKDVDPEKNSGQVLADLAALKKPGA